MNDEELNKRTAYWRLILGADSKAFADAELTEEQSIMDAALAAIYDSEESGDGGGNSSANKSKQSGGGKGRSMPNLAKWLTDIRTFFPQDVVSVIQSDAIERKG
ncbi:MAG: hypothetical protein LBD76_05455, partial [Prevotellaceae bacterium]|nr:hypothetical protein [Prevotellaceae bacterium]